MAAKLTILLSGMIAGDPYQGGATWAVLQYWLGLRRLGHDVYFVEPIAESALQPPKSRILNPKSKVIERSLNAEYFKQVAAQFGLERYGTLLMGTETVGLAYNDLRALARTADVLINISGMLTDPALVEPISRRVYLDLDPAFNQLWHAVQGIDMRFAGHTHFVTIGLAIGMPECSVPTCGYEWIKTLQPIVLEHWLLAESSNYGFTTVGNWRGYGSIEHEGTLYGQKAHSLRRFFELPMQARERFMPALAIHANEERDLEALHKNGWTLLDPAEVAATPDDYRQFIQSSKAEFGIAKSGYVVSRCGWFSDRSVCYLASGKPVLAQETGFSRFLPTGEGLLAFNETGDVLAAIDRINADYRSHARAARRIAEEHFESDHVLAQLLDEIVS